MKQFLFGVFTLILVTPIAVLHAQTPCGNIIIPEDIYNPNSPLESTPIADCADPFEKSTGTPSPYTLTIASEEVSEGETVVIPEGGTTDFEVAGNPILNSSYKQLFLHDGNDYHFVATEPFAPQESDVRTLADAFFEPDSEGDVYALVYFGDSDYFELSDSEKDIFSDFSLFVDNNFIPQPSILRSGTYTLVNIEELLMPSRSGLFEKLYAQVVPTAYAQFIQRYAFTLTFTLEEEVAVTGASSVLFLPGIQASRLYKDGLLGEDQLWEPNINQDVSQLAMTEGGESVHEVYTRDVINEIALPGIGANVYKDFLSFLRDLTSSNVIASSSAFAYDWRFDVTDIVQDGAEYENEIKSLVAEIERLSETSYTRKVTIIGHSNGGLLGKALITELKLQNKDDLVDKLVMIGTPQLGTPKAIAVMLHGFDQLAVFGQVVDDDTAREVIRNMPGAYSLLPSIEYFSKANETLVTADTSNTTTSVRAYGVIDSRQELNNFLLDTQNQRNDVVPIYEPSTLNSSLLADAQDRQQSLDSWVPPAGIQVYEVVGTGNATIKGFEYQSFPCAVGVVSQCSTGTYMKATPVLTDDGDETVVALSASGQDGVKVTGYVDLFKEGIGVLNNGRIHMDLTESSAVQNFVDSVVKYPYLSSTLVVPEFTRVSRAYKLIGTHSPVSILLTDKTGKQVGVENDEIKDEINGSQYFELGDSKYIIIPDELSFTASISGEGTGVYSLTIDEVKDGSQTSKHRFIGASTTPTMSASFSFATGTFSNIATDLNGDGTTDLTQTLDGEVIPQPVVYSYAFLKTNIKALGLKKLAEAVLLIQVEAASYWDTLTPEKPLYLKLELKALDTLTATLRLYKQKRLITGEQLTSLEVVINYLRN
jgi:pimeloyl-ACP methyl ester carboxylesterase